MHWLLSDAPDFNATDLERRYGAGPGTDAFKAYSAQHWESFISNNSRLAGDAKQIDDAIHAWLLEADSDPQVYEVNGLEHIDRSEGTPKKRDITLLA